ncbi:hypothetical protein S23_57710 [Bradyrhizobium cosmicum]|uniref:Uncharacterized protein n=1 Tax=Bradyrhizobium cosmicum TaxID=1404864 RepID=A0AAI8MIB0_9BRAD|nr:hypothetical protein S23_57710 [Bradyrhizobium cosmicum]
MANETVVRVVLMVKVKSPGRARIGGRRAMWQSGSFPVVSAVNQPIGWVASRQSKIDQVCQVSAGNSGEWGGLR